MDIARELLPPGRELVGVDPGKPEFYDAAGDAEYYLGSPRSGIGNDFGWSPGCAASADRARSRFSGSCDERVSDHDP
jgi:hypothetical protein